MCPTEGHKSLGPGVTDAAGVDEVEMLGTLAEFVQRAVYRFARPIILESFVETIEGRWPAHVRGLCGLVLVLGLLLLFFVVPAGTRKLKSSARIRSKLNCGALRLVIHTSSESERRGFDCR